MSGKNKSTAGKNKKSPDYTKGLDPEFSEKVRKQNEKAMKKKVIKKAGGGMTRQGLYPAEESRSGTMSEDERKRYMTMGKKGGGIVYRNMGRAIGGDMGGVSTVSYFYDD